VILCLLSAGSYTALFAEDLEDSLPHIPFPADRGLFDVATALGSEIASLEGMRRPPGAAFASAKVLDAPNGPVGSARHRAFTGTDGRGVFAICEDGSGRIGPVSPEAWDLEVSGYPLLQKWLAHREGQPADAVLLTELRDLVGRITELITLISQADAVLKQSIANSLTKTAMGF
jgi:hypothetical protein